MEKTRRLSIKHVPPPRVNYGMDEYSRMVETINTAQEIVSPDYTNPSMDAANYCQQQIFFVFPSFMIINRAYNIAINILLSTALHV